MSSYILRRLGLMIPTVVGGMLAIFLIFRILPGDPVLMMMSGGEGGATDPQAYAKLRHQLHLDEPLYQQLITWAGEIAQGDLGTSYQTGHPVLNEIFLRLPTTITLMVMALALTILLGIPMGVIAALRQDSALDYVIRIVGLAGLSLPSFWFGILVVLVLAVGWHWFPPVSYTQPYQHPWLSFQQLIFPAFVLGYRPVGVALRILRSSMLDEIRSDYARTAKAKGLAPRLVIVRHILRNSFLPTLTYFGLEATALLGGVVVVESIFNVPGLGQLLIQALQRRDYPMVEGVLLFVLVLVMLINLLVDLLYAGFDPRIRYR